MGEAECKASLNYTELEKERTYIDEQSITDVFKVIDEYLLNQTDSRDLEQNLNLIQTLIYNERQICYSKDVGVHRKSYRRRKLSLKRRQFKEAIDAGKLIVNGLLRLVDLKHVKDSHFECTNTNTFRIAENNRIANDTITRRIQKQADLLPRLDNIIFDIALRRAEHCLMDYRDAVMDIANMAQFRGLRRIWDDLLTQRMERGGFAANATTAFLERPRESMEFALALPKVVERDLVDIVLSMFVANLRISGAAYESLTVMSHDVFNRFVRAPCDLYINKTAPIFQTYEFDVRLIEFMPEPIKQLDRKHFLIGLQRSYYMMCKRVLNEIERFVQFFRAKLWPSGAMLA